MVNSRTDVTLARVVGLEKAISEMKSQFQKRTDRLEALNSQIEDFMLEVRASRESPLMTFPKFDGSDALGWLARADQYFLMTKIPPTSHVDVAMLAIDGPAKPWKQLLVHHCPSLSWDRFVHELLKRFGDSDAWEPKFVAVWQEIPAINTSKNHPDPDTTADNSAPLPLPIQHPIPPPVCMTIPSPTRLPTPATVTAPLLSSSPDIPQFQPPFLPLLRRLVPAAAADHAKLMVSSTPPTTDGDSTSAVRQPRYSADSVSFLFFAAMFSSRCPPVHAHGGFLSGFPIFIGGRSILLSGHAAIPLYSWPSSMVRCSGYYPKA